MNSLQELNAWGGTAIEFTDLRAPQVKFDRTSGTNQTISIVEGETHTVPVGIEIEEIINYASAQISLEIDLFNGPVGAEAVWDPVPSGTTVSSPSTRVFKISGINSVATWNLSKSPTITLPNDYFGDFNYTVRIIYIDGRTKSYVVSVSVAEVDALSDPITQFYSPNDVFTLEGVPQIIDTGVQNPVYTITITPDFPGIIELMSSTGSGGTSSFNSSTKVLTITGTKAQVNERLENIEVVTAVGIEIDFYFTYILTNNLNAETDTKIQTMLSTALQFLGKTRNSGYYVEDTPTTITGGPLITDIAYTGSGTYTLEIRPIPNTGIETISSTGTGGSSSFNNSTKVLTISGTKTQVNSHIDNIVLTTADDYVDNFYFDYVLITPNFDTATKRQDILLGSSDQDVTNMNLSRSYIAYRGNSIFSTNTPQISDNDTGVFSNLQLDSGDFTIESWINTGDSYAELINFQEQNTNKGWSFGIQSSRSLFFTSSNGTGALSTASSSTFAFNGNTWQHVAVVRQGTTLSIFANGNRVYTNASWPAILAATAGSLRIGFGYYSNGGTFSGTYGSDSYFNGYVNDIRISDSARYSGSTYTIPTAQFTDDANTLFLVHGTGANNTVDINDDNSSGRTAVTVTANGAKISTFTSKWGGGSILFDGVNDTLLTSTGLIYTINLSTNLGEFALQRNGSDADNNWVYIGTKQEINAIFDDIKFYPNAGISAPGQFRYIQLKNGIVQIDQQVELVGTAGSFTPETITFTQSTLWDPDYAFVKYGVVDILLVGGGGGGGLGGGAGGQVKEYFNQSISAQSYNIIVGTGGSIGTTYFGSTGSTAGSGQNGGDTQALNFIALGGRGGKTINYGSTVPQTTNNAGVSGGNSYQYQTSVTQYQGGTGFFGFWFETEFNRTGGQLWLGGGGAGTNGAGGAVSYGTSTPAGDDNIEDYDAGVGGSGRTSTILTGQTFGAGGPGGKVMFDSNRFKVYKATGRPLVTGAGGGGAGGYGYLGSGAYTETIVRTPGLPVPGNAGIVVIKVHT